MRDRKLALRYARALLAALDEPTVLEKTDGFLTGLAEAVDASPELRSSMTDPAVPRSARKKVLRELAAQRGLPVEVGNFLATLVDNNRISALDAIAAVFREERERKMGIVAAELITATPIDEETRQRARQALERLTGSRVNLTYRVEPGVIGGAITRIGSTVYDGSLRGQLGQLKHKMVTG